MEKGSGGNSNSLLSWHQLASFLLKWMQPNLGESTGDPDSINCKLELNLLNSLYLSKVLLFVSSCLVTFATVQAQEIPPDLKFRKYGLEDGLSQVTSHCIIQDAEGYIWIGTQDGLNRFDGNDFKVFRHDPSRKGSISDSHVKDLLEDKQGRMWVATNGGLNLFNKDTEEFTHWSHDQADSSSLSHNNVLDLIEDKQRRIWVGTEHGLNLLDQRNGTFHHFIADPNDTTTLSNDLILSMEEDDQGYLWIGTAVGLNKFDPVTETFTSYFHDPSNENSLSHDRITQVFSDALGTLWVGTRKGLNALDIESGTIRRYMHDPNLPGTISDEYILSFLEDQEHQLWVGTALGGLNLFDRTTNTFHHYKHTLGDPYSLSNNTIWTITEDSKHNLWVGVSSKGFNYVDRQTERFKHYRHVVDDPQSLLHNAVRAILLDHEDNLWVGSFLGLNVYSQKGRINLQYQHYPHDPFSLTASYVRSLLQDREQRIWVGTENGLNLYQPDSQTFSHGIKDATGRTILTEGLICVLYEDQQGRIWIGSNMGLYCISPGSTEVKHYTYSASDSSSLSHPLVRNVYQDQKGRIWVGTEMGLNLLDPVTKTFKRFLHERNNKQSLSNNIVNSIIEDQMGQIWVATAGGLNRLDPETGQFRIWREKQGLSNDVVYGILEDERGTLWMSTNKGINIFNPQDHSIAVYTQRDGLQSDEFNTGAFYQDWNGVMYFGGVNGLNVFHPDSLHESKETPTVVLTDFLLFNKSVNISDSSVLPKSVDHLTQITLGYEDDMFALEFAALDYQQPEKVQYAYKLEPYDKDWVYTDHTDRKAVYTRVPPGTYKFRVKATKDGYWSNEDRSIELSVLPPWWQTWWANTSYGVIVLTIIFLVLRFQWKRIELKQRLKLEQQEGDQLKSLDRLKTQFFSNITHEFRTPLTLIIGPIEQMLRKENLEDAFVRNQLGLIRRNSQKFLLLVNQLLDLSKLEGKKMTVESYRGDLSEFIRDIVENFRLATQLKRIQLNYESKLPFGDYLFDRMKLDKIIYNLLSNAIKNTPENGSIRLEVTSAMNGENPDGIQMIVMDTGIGIAEDNLPHIFDRFYQVDGSTRRKREGTGIGLALTKELLELQGGSIEVLSELEKGTQFTVFLPLQLAASSSDDGLENGSFESSASFEILNEDLTEDISVKESFDKNSDQPGVLIIEDSTDLRSFMKSILDPEYQILTAKDGSEGVTKALRYIPDLIISDVMMPEMDGFEVSSLIKQHQLTSHVPIILLSAKSNLQSRLKGYNTGVDAYLTKPFNTEELLVVVRKLLRSRQRLQQLFSEGKLKNSGQHESDLSDLDKSLIDTLHSHIEQELSNEDLVVEDLVREAGMSHSQLYRKIKALTNLSIAGFITNYRLSRALELLNEGAYNVTQVAYKTGFSNRRYFHRVFVEKFNCSPSEFRKIGMS